MAAVQVYRWNDGDTIWSVASSFYALSRFSAVTRFVEAIRNANPHIINWHDVKQFTVIKIPIAG